MFDLLDFFGSSYVILGTGQALQKRPILLFIISEYTQE